MKHSNKFDIVKKYYNLKMWNEDRVKNAVVKNWITADEFKEITGNIKNTPIEEGETNE